MIRTTQNVSYGPQGWQAVFRPVLILFVCPGFFIIMPTFGVQILVSGVSFAVIHTGFDLVGIFLTFVMGIAMAAAYVFGKRSLTPSIIHKSRPD